MSSLKKLAGQTIWYGVSSIAARLINYLLTPYLTFKFSDVEYGEMNIVYSFIPFMGVLMTHGMETAFFRFANTKDKQQVYSNTSISLIGATLLFSGLLLLFRQPLAQLLQITNYPQLIAISAAIIALDALTTIAFAKLRQDGRPIKFALTKVGGIFINIISVYFFISICPQLIEKNQSGLIATYYNPNYKIVYVFIANLLQSIFTFLFLFKSFIGFKWQFNKTLWKEIIFYGLPLIVAGFAGMINETFDRIMLGWWAPVNSVDAAKAEVGIYSACYKLSILITLAVQAFKMGAEPFFFKQSTEANAPKTYARVMKFFVITLTLMFLLVVLYLDVWKHFIRNPKLHVGLKVVPILLWANIFLGIYYNLSVWYKISNKTSAGAIITLIGAAITLAINAIFIPHFSYMACAWATFCCYGSMMIISFIWGQKTYRIPYAWRKLVAYMVIVMAIYGIHLTIIHFSKNTLLNYTLATLFIVLYCWFILQVEKKEFKKLPILGKYFN